MHIKREVPTFGSAKVVYTQSEAVNWDGTEEAVLAHMRATVFPISNRLLEADGIVLDLDKAALSSKLLCAPTWLSLSIWSAAIPLFYIFKQQQQLRSDAMFLGSLDWHARQQLHAQHENHAST